MPSSGRRAAATTATHRATPYSGRGSTTGTWPSSRISPPAARGAGSPGRELQNAEQGPVHRHRSDRGVRRDRPSDQGDVWDRVRDQHADGGATPDSVVGPVHLLRDSMKKVFAAFAIFAAFAF